MRKEKHLIIAVLFIMFLVGIVPIAAYWQIFSRVPTLTAKEAIHHLEIKESSTALVDVRDEESFVREHITGAVHLALSQIRQMESATELPKSLHGKELFVVCDTGFESAEATKILQVLGVPYVSTVRGGMQEWAKAGVEDPDAVYSHFVTDDQVPYLALQPMSGIKQVLQVLTGFLIKPVHMVLSVLIIWVLMDTKSLDLSLVKWALVALLIGETFCALNFIFYQDDSLLFEHFHNWGMIMSFMLAGWAFIEGLEERILKLNDPRKPCAAIGLCGRCDKLPGAQCKARQMFKWVILALIVSTFVLLTIEPGYGRYSGQIMGTPYFYPELYIFQVYEAWYLPLIAILFYGIGLLYMRIVSEAPIPQISSIFVAAGLGCLGFGIFRLGLNYLYETQALWFSFWEEATELLFVIFVAVVLWTFRQGLLGATWSLGKQFRTIGASGIHKNLQGRE